MTVDAGSVCAVEVGQNDSIAIFLQLGMKPADAFVIQSNEVVVFTADGNGRNQGGVNLAPFETFDNLNRDTGH